MKWIIKYCLICIFLCVIFSTKSFSIEDIFSTPDSLMNIGNWQDARVELEKVYFFSSDSDIKTNALMKKAHCLKQSNEFEKLILTLNRIFLYNQNDSIVFLVKYEKALAYYLNAEPGISVAELRSLNNIQHRKEENSKVKFLLALCFLEMWQWEDAKIEAVNYLNIVCDDSLQHNFYKGQIDSLFQRKNVPKYLSPEKAKNISTVIPGGGQFYSGKIGEGIFSLGIHVGLLYFGVDQFLSKFYFTGYTAGFGLLQRIYSGNLQRVQNIAKEVNQERQTGFLEDFLAILIEASS